MARTLSINGIRLQEFWSKAGQLLYRSYLYLPITQWRFIHDQAKAKEFSSASEYINHLVTREMEN